MARRFHSPIWIYRSPKARRVSHHPTQKLISPARHRARRQDSEADVSEDRITPDRVAPVPLGKGSAGNGPRFAIVNHIDCLLAIISAPRP